MDERSTSLGHHNENPISLDDIVLEKEKDYREIKSDEPDNILHAQMRMDPEHRPSARIIDFAQYKRKPTDLMLEPEVQTKEQNDSHTETRFEAVRVDKSEDHIPTAVDLAMQKTDSYVEPKKPEDDREHIPTAAELAMKATDKYIPSALAPGIGENIETKERVDVNLEKARNDYIKLSVDWKVELGKKKFGFAKTLANLGVDKQLPESEEPEELRQARVVYNEAKKAHAKNLGLFDLVETRTKGEEGSILNLKEYKYEVNPNLTDFRERESEILKRAMEEARPEIEKTIAWKALDAWKRLPQYGRLSVSIALGTLGSVAFGGLAATVGPVGYAGYRIKRMAMTAPIAGVAGATVGRAVDGIFKKKNEETHKDAMDEYEMYINEDNFNEREAKAMRFNDKEISAKKRQMVAKAGAILATGFGVAAGLEAIDPLQPKSTGINSIENSNKSSSGPTEKASVSLGNVEKKLEMTELDKERNLPETKTESVLETSVELSSKGFIQDIHNLKANILAEYQDKEIPESLKKNILDKPSSELAKQFNFFDAEKNASGVGFKGEHLGLDKDGNIFYQHLDGKKQIMFDSSTGTINKFNGDMAIPEAKAEVTGTEIYPKVDFGAGKNFIPESSVTPSTEVLPGDPILHTDSGVKETFTANTPAVEKHISLPGGKFADVVNINGEKGLLYDGVNLAHETTLGGDKILTLNDEFQDGLKYLEARGVFVQAFENTVKTENLGPYPIAESFEGGKIYVAYNIPSDPNKVSVLLNGKEIASGTLTSVKNGIPKIKMHRELKGGWFIVDNVYERAFKHINGIIKNNPSLFKI